MSGPLERFPELFAELAAIGAGRDRPGWTRLAFTAADQAAGEWFVRTAAALGLAPGRDRFGNWWAWWGAPGPGALLLGSHLDTVAEGGCYDGALGVVAGLVAVAAVAAGRPGGGEAPGPLAHRVPARPVAVVAFAEEEGGRFGQACLGSRLVSGSLAPAAALALVDAAGTRLAAALPAAGVDPAAFAAPGPDLLAGVEAAVELHVEQGRALAELDAPLGVGSAIQPHGRWRLEILGRADHAGTTRLADRADPVLLLAEAVLAARHAAASCGGVATIGRVALTPNATNVIPGVASAWLDARAPTPEGLAELLARFRAALEASEHAAGLRWRLVEESRSPQVRFDEAVAARLARLVAARGHPVVRLQTAAGHDAGVLAERVPTGMLFVRNPTGASHTPAEHAEDADCRAGVEVLADLVGDWIAAPPGGAPP